MVTHTLWTRLFCLARRIDRTGVPVVEVSLSGAGPLGGIRISITFKVVQSLSEQLGLGWSQLMIELEERGLLESTTIAWMGEFGRTPQSIHKVAETISPMPGAVCSVVAESKAVRLRQDERRWQRGRRSPSHRT